MYGSQPRQISCLVQLVMVLNVIIFVQLILNITISPFRREQFLNKIINSLPIKFGIERHNIVLEHVYRCFTLHCLNNSFGRETIEVGGQEENQQICS